MRLLMYWVPTSVVRFLNQLRFKLPFLQKPINWFTRLMLGNGIGIIQRGDGCGLRFDARGCNPGFLFGTSEPLEQKVLVSNLKSGDVFYDIGANAGFYCVIAARIVGDTGRVYAFEPTPDLAARIKRNAELNNFKNIEVIVSAVADRVGTVAFGVAGSLSVENSIRSAVSTAAECMTVQCITVDTFAATHTAPTLIMIDVEGAEIDVLKGAMETIAQHLPVIMVEVHWLGDEFIQFVEQYLRPLGYKATTYDGKSLPNTVERYHCLLAAERS